MLSIFSFQLLSNPFMTFHESFLSCLSPHTSTVIVTDYIFNCQTADYCSVEYSFYVGVVWVLTVIHVLYYEIIVFLLHKLIFIV